MKEQDEWFVARCEELLGKKLFPSVQGNTNLSISTECRQDFLRYCNGLHNVLVGPISADDIKEWNMLANIESLADDYCGEFFPYGLIKDCGELVCFSSPGNSYVENCQARLYRRQDEPSK